MRANAANLTELRLANNQIQELPEAFSELVDKGFLFIEGNENLTTLNGTHTGTTGGI
jgi:Leucine-rich repeat (LRR) protein